MLRLFLLLSAVMLAATADDRWLSMEDLAARLGMQVPTLRDWRARGYGPQGVKFGTARGAPVRYRLSEVERFEAEMEAAEAGRAVAS
jgi:hypothetical protein